MPNGDGIYHDPLISGPVPQARLPQGYPQRQQFVPSLNDLAGEQVAMADLPPVPELHKPPLADPIRPRPLVANPNLSRIQEIRSRLRELDKIETGLQSQGGPEQVDRRTLRGKLSDEDEARFKELARQGLTHQQIADQLGIGKANVTRRMHNLIDSGQLSKDEIRRQIGGPLPQPFERQEELERLLKSGMTHQAISSQMKIGAQTFYQALKKMREGSEAVPQREKAVGLGFGVPGKKGLVPSMPEFKFKDKAPDKIDKEYMEELEKYLKDLQSYYDAISGGKYV